MQFEPKTKEQAQEENQFPVWEAGIYAFDIGKAEEQVSKKGNEMIKISLNVYNDNNQVQIVFDYLMPSMSLKLIEACECMGLIEEYNQGCLEAYQFEGKTGQVRLNIRPEQTDKTTGKKYPAKNEVHSYIVEGSQSTNSVAAPDLYEKDDPFNY